MEQKIIKINNFQLNIFRNLLDQSLIVDNQLMLEISSSMIKSCSLSMTKSFMKLWTIPLKNLLVIPENESTDGILFPNMINKPVENIFPTFNLYILKGDLFIKFFSVHNSETVDLEFTLHTTSDD